MPYNRYIQITEDRYNTLISRYEKFIENINDDNQKPISIFDPLPKKFLDELEVIREVSRELALKKDEDLKKAEKQNEVETKVAEAAENEDKTNETEETPATV